MKFFGQIFLNPIVSLFWNPLRLWKTIVSCRILFDGRWSDFNMFGARHGLNNLFYRVHVVNIEKFGRSGHSPLIGTGNYPLRNWWHLSLLGSYLYCYLGPVLPVVGMISWWGMHFLWLDSVADLASWKGLVLLLALLSTKFYSVSFILMNYNVLGWLFVPLAIFGWLQGMWWVAAAGWFFASFGSITTVVMGGFLAVFAAVLEQEVLFVVSMIPAGLKFGGHLVHAAQPAKRGGGAPLDMTAKAVGINRKSAKYKRPSRQNVRSRTVYWILVYTGFGLLLHGYSFENGAIWWGSLVLYLVNQSYKRFADDEQFHMLFFTLATAFVLSGPVWTLVIYYWILVSPVVRALPEAIDKTSELFPRPVKPFRVRAVLDRLESFFDSVRSGERVMLAFSDPEGQYQNLFDGYRILVEPCRYLGSLGGYHCFPDFPAVFENNYEGAPDFWGRSVHEVEENCRKWNADYAVVYQATETELDRDWLEAGFELEGVLDWGLMVDKELAGEVVWEEKNALEGAPKWWLLRVPDRLRKVPTCKSKSVDDGSQEVSTGER